MVTLGFRGGWTQRKGPDDRGSTPLRGKGKSQRIPGGKGDPG
ncbi:hypothetical protein chiPu_0023686, partial [Chiloscyllium punctatum]|nr:hypothetical protein [Chiloscyllium punctatum]